MDPLSSLVLLLLLWSHVPLVLESVTNHCSSPSGWAGDRQMSLNARFDWRPGRSLTVCSDVIAQCVPLNCILRDESERGKRWLDSPCNSRYRHCQSCFSPMRLQSNVCLCGNASADRKRWARYNIRAVWVQLLGKSADRDEEISLRLHGEIYRNFDILTSAC